MRIRNPLPASAAIISEATTKFNSLFQCHLFVNMKKNPGAGGDLLGHLRGESNQMKIAVVDGQGGGIGGAVIKRVREEFGETFQILALGTNSIATAQMMRARANKGATGENAIVQTAPKAQVIVGPIGIVLAQSMMGEVTPAIAQAVADSPALKLLIPLSQENVEIMGYQPEPLPHLIEKLILRLKEYSEHV